MFVDINENTMAIERYYLLELQENVACRPKNHKKVGFLVREEQGKGPNLLHRRNTML